MAYVFSVEDWRPLPDFLEIASGVMAPEVLHEVDVHGAGFHVRLSEFPSFDYYVDPLVGQVAAKLDAGITVENIRHWCRGGSRWQLSMNDAWTLPAWDAWLDPEDDRPILLLHADDHDDLMVPRLHVEDGEWLDALTGSRVRFGDGSIAEAVRSSAVGMGSFLTVMAHHPRVVELRHLRGRQHRVDDGEWLQRVLDPDPLWHGRQRPAVRAESGPGAVRFRRVADVNDWVAGIPENCVVLVHIDLDFLSNRYDCDSDWPERTDLFDPTEADVWSLLQRTLAAVDVVGDRVAGVALALSPGFFPAEYWLNTVETIDQWAAGRDG